MNAELARASATPERVGLQLLQRGKIAAVAAVSIQTVLHLTNEFVLGDRIESVDADVEGGIFTWASSAAVFAVAPAALVYAAAVPVRRRAFLFVAATAAFFSLDDTVQVHERIALRVGENLLGLPDYAAVRLWLVFYLPLLALMAAVLWTVARDVWTPAGNAIRLGLVLLALSIPAEVAGLVTRPLEEDGQEAPNDLRVAVEEAFELGGWIVVATGVTAAVAVALMKFRHD
ncbi:MAG: hypothetical protein M3310_01350 [Actinomycetota bacterium]|nr:hypothetical protein [Actinomycetota bacterium]